MTRRKLRSSLVWLLLLLTIGTAALFLLTENLLVAAAGGGGLVSLWIGLSAVRLGWPLLVKELLEMAARRRTWVFRTLYAVLGLIVAGIMSASLLSQRGSSLELLGQGRQLFQSLYYLQLIGIYLFLPAMSSSLITVEKERETFELLQLTRLGPWGIITSKLLSRIIPMSLLSTVILPLFAFAYSLGGFEAREIAIAIMLLLVAMLQASVTGLLCSILCRTTGGALICTYAGLLLTWFLPMMLHEGVDVLHDLLAGWSPDGNVFGWSRQWCHLALSVPWLLEFVVNLQPWVLIVPALMVIGGQLLICRWRLIPSGAKPSRSLLSHMAGWFRRIAARVRRRRDWNMLRVESRTLDHAPVLWLESVRHPLGSTSFLVVSGILIEGGLLLFWSMNTRGWSGNLEWLYLLLYSTWLIGGLSLCSLSTGLFASERSGQTLDVLLVAPLSNRELLSQKFRSLLPVMRLLGIMILTMSALISFEYIQAANHSIGDKRNSTADTGAGLRLIGTLTTLVIYLPMISLVGLIAGLKCRTRSRAIVAALGVLAGWSLLPLLLLTLFSAVGAEPELIAWTLGSPLVIFAVIESVGQDENVAALILHVLWYGSILLGLRGWTLHLNRDGLLERRDSPPD